MGKISRGRRKYHSSKGMRLHPEAQLVEPQVTTSLPLYDMRENIFSGLNISEDVLKQDLDVQSIAEDNKSIISKKSFKSDRPYKKKDKRILRREAFLAKLNVVKQNAIEAKERKKREKTVITGDMRPLADALPVVTDIPSNLSSPQPKKRSIPKAKKRQQDMLRDIEWMMQINLSRKSS